MIFIILNIYQNVILTEEEINFFHKNGYLKIKNVLDKKQIELLGKTILLLCKKYAKHDFDDISSKKCFDDKKFHNAIIKLKEKNPRVFGAIYDSLQCSVALQSLLISDKTLKIISTLSGEPPENHSLFHSLIRMDVPKDSRNKLSWHQDFVSSEKIMDHPNGMVAWITLVNVNYENGAIEICPKSHTDSNAKNMIVKKRNGDKNTSEYLDVPKSIIDKYSSMVIKAEVGDIVIMSMTILHQSGINASNLIRFTALGRYYPMNVEDFLPGRRVYIPSDIKI